MTAAPQHADKPPQAIIFDWDNTLVDSWPVIGDALNTTLKAFGHHPWTDAEVRTRVRKSMRESFPELFGDRWQDAADVFYERYGAIHAQLIEPIPGIDAMLSQLTDMGIYLAVVSNKTGDFLRTEADHLGWQGHFGRLVGAYDAKRDKPATEPVHMALEGGPRFDGPRNTGDVWFAGDTDIDMECAINANCLPVLLRQNAPEKGEFDIFSPRYHFQTGQELCKQLLTLYAGHGI